MSDMPVVGRIFVHPIKSLDPVEVREAVVLPSGALRHDREFALFDENETRLNGKGNVRIHLIRAGFDMDSFSVNLSSPRDPHPRRFQLMGDTGPMQEWFSDFFGFAVRLKRNTDTGFPDDLDSPGPTVISSATLAEVGSWFGIADRLETSRRFRTNIEIDCRTPFWEDRLFGGIGEIVEFRVGDVGFQGINPCRRCVVPSRDPASGVAIDGFQRSFSERRAAKLPSWTVSSRFDHHYRLAVNTRIPPSEAGKILHSGDAVRV